MPIAVSGPGPRGAPQLPQKLSPAEIVVPQLAQRSTNAAPQLTQCWLSEAFNAPHARQFISHPARARTQKLIIGLSRHGRERQSSVTISPSRHVPVIRRVLKWPLGPTDYVCFLLSTTFVTNLRQTRANQRPSELTRIAKYREIAPASPWSAGKTHERLDKADSSNRLGQNLHRRASIRGMKASLNRAP